MPGSNPHRADGSSGSPEGIDSYVESPLRFRYGEALAGDLEHWHYETFLVLWRDCRLGRELVLFTMNSRGAVDTLNAGVSRHASARPTRRWVPRRRAAGRSIGSSLGYLFGFRCSGSG